MPINIRPVAIPQHKTNYKINFVRLCQKVKVVSCDPFCFRDDSPYQTDGQTNKRKKT